ncbi:MAG: two-component regulator propeller domain-containing protein [Saprospiraceae bacterium]
MRYIIIISCLLFSTHSIAQNQIAIESWRTHFPVNQMVSVTQSATTVYYASEQMIIALDKEERSIRRIDKVNGLSQVGIKVIRYYSEMELLLVAYKDGNIDVVTETGITNIADIKRYSLIADKSIYHIHFNGTFAFLSCSFGVVQLDLENNEVKNTFLTDNFDVNASYIWNDTIFIATEAGIYQGNLNLNLGDFTNWSLHGASKGISGSYYSNVMSFFEGKLFANINDALKYYDGSDWKDFESRTGNNEPTTPNFIRFDDYLNMEPSLDGKKLMLATSLSITAIDPDGLAKTFFGLVQNPRQLIRDGNEMYFADLSKGAVILKNFVFTQVTANAPFSKNINQMAFQNDELWISSGGVNSAWQSLSRSEGLFNWKDGIWSVKNPSNTDSLKGVWDIIPVVFHPSNGKVYAGSYRRGLVEIDGDNVRVYGKDDSVLSTPPLDPNTTRVTGLAFDEEENLWISNYEALKPVVVFRSNGTWESYPLPSASSQIAEMVIDRNNNKWMVVARGTKGLAVFNENEIVSGGVDNRYRILTTANSELPSNSVNCLAVDKDGDVWVGTLEGTVVFECGSQLFDTDGCAGRKVIVEEDDFGEYLLKTENVTTIAIDGANRKWFGTNNGIFVQSPDGESTVFRFTEENSPLPSNNIIDIAINGNNGEVFIATEAGLVSYRSDAVDGEDVHAPEVYAYPNPVRPNYEGPIAVKGLVENANVKITDISGSLIFETTALGGQVIWDGRDYNGRKAASGVYLIFSSNNNGLQTLATKVVLLN